MACTEMTGSQRRNSQVYIINYFFVLYYHRIKQWGWGGGRNKGFRRSESAVSVRGIFTKSVCLVVGVREGFLQRRVGGLVEGFRWTRKKAYLRFERLARLADRKKAYLRFERLARIADTHAVLAAWIARGAWADGDGLEVDPTRLAALLVRIV